MEIDTSVFVALPKVFHTYQRRRRFFDEGSIIGINFWKGQSFGHVILLLGGCIHLTIKLMKKVFHSGRQSKDGRVRGKAPSTFLLFHSGSGSESGITPPGCAIRTRQGGRRQCHARPNKQPAEENTNTVTNTGTYR